MGAGTGNIAAGEGGFVGGGLNNTAGLSGNLYAAVIGGAGNTATGPSSLAHGTSCVITGSNSVGLGNQSQDGGHNGCFVFSDTSAATTSGGNNTFTIGCSGGAQFYSTNARATGVNLAAGGNSWTSTSDRNLKENLRELDSADVLERVEKLPIYEYNFIGAPSGMLYRGPTAQDWHALFPSGKNPRGIDTMDLDGITLAAVKGLSARLLAQDAQIQALRREVAALKTGSGALL